MLTDPTDEAPDWLLGQCLDKYKNREGLVSYDQFAFKARGRNVKQSMHLRWTVGVLDDPLKCTMWFRKNDACQCQVTKGTRGYVGRGFGWRQPTANRLYYLPENPKRCNQAPPMEKIPKPNAADFAYLWQGSGTDYVLAFGHFLGWARNCRCTFTRAFTRMKADTNKGSYAWKNERNKWVPED